MGSPRTGQRGRPDASEASSRPTDSIADSSLFALVPPVTWIPCYYHLPIDKHRALRILSKCGRAHGALGPLLYTSEDEKMATLKEVFRREYKGASNFMTPEFMGYFERGQRYFVELSGGRGMSNEPIFGVTVVDAQGRRPDLSKLFHNEQEARDYIRDLIK